MSPIYGILEATLQSWKNKYFQSNSLLEIEAHIIKYKIVHSLTSELAERLPHIIHYRTLHVVCAIVTTFYSEKIQTTLFIFWKFI